MSDRFAAHRPRTITKLSNRTRRLTGAAAAIPALLIAMLGSTHSPPPHDSGLVACRYPLTTRDVPAAALPEDPRRVRRLALAGPAHRWHGLRRPGHRAAHRAGHRRIPDRLVHPAALRHLRKTWAATERQHLTNRHATS